MSAANLSSDPGNGVQAPVGEIFSLTSIRGLAATWVVLLHFSGVLFGTLPELSFLKPLIAAGGFAVPLFFILSGYVLGLRYLTKLGNPSRVTILRFWWLRLGRIYPVHFFTLAVSLLMVARHGWPTDEGHSRARFIANCLLTQAWSRHFRLSWNYPSWSISSEWFAYLLFPLVAVVLTKTRRQWLPVLVVVACALSAAVYACEQNLAFSGLLVVVPTFVGGVLLATACPLNESAQPWRWTELGVVAAAALPFLIGARPLLGALYIVLFFALVGLLGVAGNRSARVWRNRKLVYLGDISYSLYMTHVITITLLTRLLPPPTLPGVGIVVRLGVTLGYLTAIVGVAIGTYYAIEQPLRRLSRGLARHRGSNNPPADLPAA